MQKLLKDNAPAIIFIVFLIFYLLQVPSYTYKSDVITFAVRSMAEKPIIEFAYLNSETLLYTDPLINYHLGHTIILWFIYQIFTEPLAVTILPAGIFSAFCAALVVLLTYLIWINLGISKRKSLFIAVTFGLVPTFWEHGTIGEIHALQMLFIMLFVYAFIKGKYVVSSIAFLMANLVSPLSGLAFGLLFLKGFGKQNLLKAFFVGLSALTIYLFIYYMIGANLLSLLAPVSQQVSGRGIPYRITILLIFIAINFNLFLYYLYKGILLTIKTEKRLLIYLMIAAIPQVLLVFISAGFFIEYGSFQILLFWALAFPLGYYLSGIKLKSKYFIFSLVFTAALTYSIWLNPHKVIGSALNKSGEWLKANSYYDISIIGPWNVGIDIIYARNGAKLDYFNKYYFDIPEPTDIDLIKTKKEKLIIAKYKKPTLRNAIADMNIPGLTFEEYYPEEIIECGKLEHLYENNYISLYKWEK